jgi:hypothetical protein
VLLLLARERGPKGHGLEQAGLRQRLA